MAEKEEKERKGVYRVVYNKEERVWQIKKMVQNA